MSGVGSDFSSVPIGINLESKVKRVKLKTQVKIVQELN